jgi:hypothetical protein
MAARQGYMLRKSQRRNRRALDYENYWLVDPESNSIVAGDEFGWSLNDVEEWLTSDQPVGTGSPRRPAGVRLARGARLGKSNRSVMAVTPRADGERRSACPDA